MPEQRDVSAEQLRLAEYEVWDRVERRLWSRVRWILAAMVVGAVALAVLYVPLLRASIERDLSARLLSEVRQEIEANKLDVPALRREMREDAKFIKDQLVAGQVDLEIKMQKMIEQAGKLDSTIEQVDEESRRLNSLRAQINVLQRNLSGETGRVEQLRARFESELQEFLSESKRMMSAMPSVVDNQMDSLSRIVERDLDELRSILADHMAGTPALMTTYLNLRDRSGQIKGTNFGLEPGRVFMKVRAFPAASSEVTAESESILIPLETWADNEIALRVSERVLEKVAEAKNKIAPKAKAGDTIIRYGFMVQTADGRISHWSGKWADSLIPPSRGTVERN